MSEFIFEDWVICPDDPTATLERINQYKDYYQSLSVFICGHLWLH